MWQYWIANVKSVYWRLRMLYEQCYNVYDDASWSVRRRKPREMKCVCKKMHLWMSANMKARGESKIEKEEIGEKWQERDECKMIRGRWMQKMKRGRWVQKMTSARWNEWNDVGKRTRRKQSPKMVRVDSDEQSSVPLKLGLRNKTIAVANNGQVIREDVLSTDRHAKLWTVSVW